MKNYIHKKARYLKAMMLTTLVGLFAFNGYAQTFNSVTLPAGTYYAGEEAQVTYNASTYPAGTNFILWNDANTNNAIEPGETIYDQSTVQDTDVDLDITWPDNNFRLALMGFSGNAVEGTTINVNNSEVSVVGSNSTNFAYYFGRASARALTTASYDLSSTEQTKLFIGYNDFGLDATNPIEVLFSTDNFATAGTVLTEVSTDTEFTGGGGLEFILPPAAKTAATSFRIRQKGTADYGTTKDWSVSSVTIEIGDTYTRIAGTGELSSFLGITNPSFNITGILDDVDAAATTFSPGEVIKINAELQNVDFANVDFVGVLRNKASGAEYVLEPAPATKNSTLNTIQVVSEIPTEIMYNTAFNGWEVQVYAYDGTDPEFGLDVYDDFTDGVDIDATVTGGTQNGTGLVFDQAGDRSVTTAGYNVTSTEGYVSMYIGRKNDLLSPSGTDVVVEYSTDGGANYANFATVSLNDIATTGAGSTLIEQSPLDADMISSSTMFRVRQLTNNGANLDAWVLEDFEIVNNSNIVSASTITPATSDITINRPGITVDAIDFGVNGLAYPMEAYDLTYTIDNGEFPAGTGATAFLQRTGNPDTDIIIGTTADITSGTIAITVPPIVEGDYTVYLYSDNGEQYYSANMAIYNLDLQVTSIDYDVPVDIAGTIYTNPGQAITVNYTLNGTPTAGAELMLKVYNDVTGEYDMIATSTSISSPGTITGTLPVDNDYGPNPEIALSLGSAGVYGNNLFGEIQISEYWYANVAPDFAVIEGGSTFNGFESALTSDGTRSITYSGLDIPYGGTVYNAFRVESFDFPVDVKIQASADGIEWYDLFTYTTTGITNYGTGYITIPTAAWSNDSQVRFIYNEDGASGFEENVIAPYQFVVYTPEFLESAMAFADLNLIRPSLAVNEYDKTTFAIGEEVTINYNAVGFPAGTEYAAVIEQNGEYVVLETAAAQDAASITTTMPIGFGDLGDPYNLEVIPFAPATAGGDFIPNQSLVNVDQAEDFIAIQGQNPSYVSNNDRFVFDRNGSRSLLTRAFDLSNAESAVLGFDFNAPFGYGNYDVTANKNIVPRLEVSTDGGATFEVIPVYELAPGETQIYDDGLLYLQQFDYEVEIPSAYLTAATHFRWSQPLNLGQSQNRWMVQEINLTINQGNELPDYSYVTTPATNPIAIDLTAPDLGGYVWSQADLQDAVFNGEAFDYSWDVNAELAPEDIDDFPAGTEFVFTLSGATDPETGEDVIIGTTSALGVASGNIPLYVGDGNFTVDLTATLEVNGEEFMIYDQTPVGNLAVFNVVLQTSFDGDENEIYYAGNEVTIDYAFENDVTSTGITGLYYNLLLDYAGDDWLLAVDESFTGSFTVDMPPFVNGNVDFVVVASIGGPLGVIGEPIDGSGIGYLSSNDEWLNEEIALTGGLPGNGATMANVSGRRVLTTADFDLVADNSSRISFYLDYANGVDPVNILSDQELVFEYSTDGGATYTTIQKWPEDGATEPLPFGANYSYAIMPDMKTTATRFRFRQEESRFTIYIDDMRISQGEEAEIVYETADDNGFVPNISQQAIQISSINTTEVCLDAMISVDYEIRGKFGADNVVMVEYYNGNDIEGYSFNITEGTGTIEFGLPDVLDQGDDNESYKFRLVADDDTYEAIGFPRFITGTYNEVGVEIVAPILTDAEFGFNTPLACESEDVIVELYDEQDYFMYEVLNGADDSVLGTLLYDPETGEDEINIGPITETTSLKLRITAMSSTGNLTCNTLVSSYTDVVEVQQIHQLYSNNGGAGSFRLVTAGQSISTCNDDGTDILEVRRLLADGSTTSSGTDFVEWFRDNVNNPVETGTVLENRDVTQSGAYFARVTTSTCAYTTESIQIDVVDIPNKPVITIVSGNLEDCSTADPIVLGVTGTFAFYEWSTGATTPTISVDESDNINVRVSNVPFGTGCSSEYSAPVDVDRYDLADFAIWTNETNEFIGNSDEFDVCEDMYIRLYDGGSWTNSGNVTVIKDGADYASIPAGTREYIIDESGVYSFDWGFNNLNVDCTISSNEFTVNVIAAPTASPTLTADGNATFCENDGTVTLTAPTGFDYYRWRRNGGTITSPTSGVVNTNTYEASLSGTYTVEVGNAVGCYSPESNGVTVTVIAEPNMNYPNQQTTNCGSGEVEFTVANNNGSAMILQLINGNTGLPSGASVTAPPNTTVSLFTDVVEVDRTPFYVEFTYADGSGCTVSNPDFFREANVRNVVLSVQGANLIATYETSNVRDVRWFRNGVLLNNAGGSSITVADAADYTVEVEYNNGCVVTASSADLTRVLSAKSGASIEVNTYPNPTVSDFTVAIASEYMGLHQVVITTLTGQVMKTERFEKSSFESKHEISIAGLQSGIYNMQIQYDGLVKNVRIIKK